MAYADEIAAANRLKTLEERFAARNAVRAKYGMEPEKKTRGGLAEVYDRNKAVVQAAVPALAGMLVPGAGALAGAVAGGVARGLDRPSEAAQGALSGLGLGALGSAARTGLGQLFGARGAGALKPMAAPTGPSVGSAATPMGTVGATAAPTAAPAAASAVAPAAPATPKPGMMSNLLTTVQKPEVLAPLAGGVADVLGAAQDRAAKERQVKLEERQMQLEQERQARLAQLLMPLFEQQIGRAGRTR